MSGPDFTVDDLGSIWGKILGQQLIQIVTLEKVLAQAQAEIQRLMTENETLKGNRQAKWDDEMAPVPSVIADGK